MTETDEPSGGWKIEFTVSDWMDWLFQRGGKGMGKLDAHAKELEDRLDTVGWGLLFLLFGALALPNGTAEYAAAAAIGAAMLGLNGLRIIMAVPVRWFSIILGAVMLVAGGAALAGTKMDVFVLFFALAGVVTIAGAVVQPRRSAAH
jgi:hypothetical protein